MTKAEIKRTKLSYIVHLPHITDEASLCFGEAERHMPFPIRRVYYISKVLDNSVRGKHAHKETLQMLFCIQGSITILLDNGKEKEILELKEPNQGVFLDKMMWHEMSDFKKDTILLVFASDYYDEADYIRNYTDFINSVKHKKYGTHE